MSLDSRQRAVAEAERDRLRQVGPNRDHKVSGCFVAFAGMIVLTLTPAVGGWLDIPPGLALGILAGAVLLLAGGAAIGLIGGARQETNAARAREEAVEALTRWAEGSTSEDDAIRAAVRFLHAGGGIRVEATRNLPSRAHFLVDQVARSGLRDAAEP